MTLDSISEALKIMGLLSVPLGAILSLLTWFINSRIKSLKHEMTLDSAAIRTSIVDLKSTIQTWTTALLDHKYVTKERLAVEALRITHLEDRFSDHIRKCQAG